MFLLLKKVDYEKGTKILILDLALAPKPFVSPLV